MSLNLEDKKAVVAEVAAQVANAQTIVVAEYRGVQVVHLTLLRKKARESGVFLRVLKNTLVRRAVADTPFAELSTHMVGPLIYSISADPVAAAKPDTGACMTPNNLASNSSRLGMLASACTLATSITRPP